jgi:hypothetical protein
MTQTDLEQLRRDLADELCAAIEKGDDELAELLARALDYIEREKADDR